MSHAGGPLPSQDALPGAATASAQATQPPAIWLSAALVQVSLPASASGLTVYTQVLDPASCRATPVVAQLLY